jgi:hypothetical protein
MGHSSRTESNIIGSSPALRFARVAFSHQRDRKPIAGCESWKIFRVVVPFARLLLDGQDVHGVTAGDRQGRPAVDIDVHLVHVPVSFAIKLLNETAKGATQSPSHVVVVSRAHKQNGDPKLLYHALVCKCPLGIPRSSGGTSDIGTLRNFGNGGKRIDRRQITAVVQQTTRNGDGHPYPITVRATLVAPYAVRLAAPRELSRPERDLLDEVSRDGKTPDDWIAFAKRLRRI